MSPSPDRLATTLSTKGQVILPKAIRERRGWRPGARLLVEDTPEGVLLKPAPLFTPTTIEDVLGCLPYNGPARTLEDMDAAVADEARRHAGD
jgi:AbrB family looped-hinge helix DNA binding protein